MQIFPHCRQPFFKNLFMIHEADHSPGPVVITISHRVSVRPSQNFKIKQQSLLAGTVGWPSGSLITPVLLIIVSAYVVCTSVHSQSLKSSKTKQISMENYVDLAERIIDDTLFFLC